MNRNLMNRVLCFVNILLLLVSFAKPVAYAKTQKTEEKKDKYIIQTDNTSKYNKMKKEFQSSKKNVVNHKDADEEYLAESQSVVVAISKEEAEKLADQSGVTVEKDYTVTADSTKNGRKNMAAPKAIPIEMTSEETPSEEYTIDAAKFVPCEPVTDPDKKMRRCHGI